MKPRAAIILLIAFGAARATPSEAQELRLPPRPTAAPVGSEIVRELRSLDLPTREERIYAEIARGNVPSWLGAARDFDRTMFWAAEIDVSVK